MKITLDAQELEEIVINAMRTKFNKLVSTYEYMTVSVDKPVPVVTVTINIKTRTDD